MQSVQEFYKDEAIPNGNMSNNCEVEFMLIVRDIIMMMNPHHLQRNCVDWLMKNKEKLIELNKIYKISQKEDEDEP